ncbi:uncharacterized protein LOC142341151 [Convolutriloba macropyga]|uniref:uncharacterized protein LOC142341151 n=1 Tax=Convolutriloba macropyga TaxID=536237 RepID=UPI003F525BA9
MGGDPEHLESPQFYKEQQMEAKSASEKRTLQRLRKAYRHTAPYDPRYPNTNKTKYCWSNFVDYQRCLKIKGDEHAPCDYFKFIYLRTCPSQWREKWNEQLDNGIFVARI